VNEATEGGPSRGARLVAPSILLLFAALRLALLDRPRFFDEAFTQWITRFSPAGILEALRLDSGPPLYYWLVLPVSRLAGESLSAIRLVSLLASLVAVGAILMAPLPRTARRLAALFLAVYPAAVYFATEARSYALAAMFLAIAAVLLLAWRESGRGVVLGAATAALLLAGYSHYYAVLFFPAPLIFALEGGARERWRAVAAVALLAVMFVPGFALAAAQPPEAIGWQGSFPERSLIHLPAGAGFAPLMTFGGRPPAAVAIAAAAVSILLLVLSLGTAAGRALTGSLAAAWVALIAFELAGRGVYFPFRFEAAAAPLLVMAMAAGAMRLPRSGRLVAVALVCGFAALSFVNLFAGKGSSTGRERAVQVALDAAGAEGIVVASGFAYLEAAVGAGDRLVEAFPREQGEHPGWRAWAPESRLRSEAGGLPSQFVWVGSTGDREYAIVSERYAMRPVFFEGGFGVARAWSRTVAAAPESSR
jgi:hypothetical protein